MHADRARQISSTAKTKLTKQAIDKALQEIAKAAQLGKRCIELSTELEVDTQQIDKTLTDLGYSVAAPRSSAFGFYIFSISW